eukprot:g3076.t1
MKIWTLPVNEVLQTASVILEILGFWMDSASSLCQDFILQVDVSDREWKLGPYHTPLIPLISQRLEQALELRVSYNEVCRLLDDSHLCKTTTEAFEEIRSLSVFEWMDDAKWEDACAKHEECLLPLNNSLLQILRNKFHNQFLPKLKELDSLDSSFTVYIDLFEDISKHKGLLNNKVLRPKLISELGLLAEAINNCMEELEDAYRSHREKVEAILQKTYPSTAMELPCLAQEHTTTMLFAKTVMSVKSVLEQLYPDDLVQEDVVQSSTESASLLQKQCNHLSERSILWWKSTMVKYWSHIRIQSAGSCLEDHKTEAEDNSSLLTNQFILFVKEVKDMASLGVTISDDLLIILKEAEELSNVATTIDEIRQLHDVLVHSLLPCHKPLLNKEINDLESLLTNPVDPFGNRIKWDNIETLSSYCKKLKKTMDCFSEKHNFIQMLHKKIRSRVESLVQINILKEKSKWNENIEAIEAMFSEAESAGYQSNSHHLWRQHWDVQLHRVLDFQFRLITNNILSNLPKIDVALILRGNKIFFEPSIEEIRVSLFNTHVNSVLHQILDCKGVSDLSDNPEFFQSILSRNGKRISMLYKELESILNLLTEELKKHQEWTRSFDCNVEDLIKQDSKVVKDWDQMYSHLEERLKELKDAPVEKHLHRFRLSFIPFKTEAKRQIKKLKHELLEKLKSQVLEGIEEITNFMYSGQQTLDSCPETTIEINQNLLESRQLLNSLGKMLAKQKTIVELNTLIKNITDEDPLVEECYSMASEWDEFVSNLESCGDLIQQKAQSYKERLEIKTEGLREELRIVCSRWQELKPSNVQKVDKEVILARLQQFSNEANRLQTQITELQEEFTNLEMSKPEFVELDTLVEDVNCIQTQWSVYIEFSTKLSNLLDTSWIILRDKVWELEDFVTWWKKAIEDQETINSFTNLLFHKELDPVRKLIPFLKDLKGRGWNPNHWKRLFRMLNLTNNHLTNENLKLRQLVEKVDGIGLNISEIKALDSQVINNPNKHLNELEFLQAKGEGVLRSALDEISLWSFERKFTLSEIQFDLNSSSQDSILIVKDWSKLIEEVSDTYQIAMSLESSPYSFLVKGEIDYWTDQLTLLTTILTELSLVQQKWIQLAPVLMGDSLSTFQSQFSHPDRQFRVIMDYIKANRTVMHLLEYCNIEQELSEILEELSRCHVSLIKYLEEQRDSFPRFYFVGDDDLLTMLGQRRESWFSLINKVFNGVHQLKINNTTDRVIVEAVVTEKGEVVDLESSLEVGLDCCQWLTALEIELMTTLQSQLKKQTPNLTCTQIASLASAIQFTHSVEHSFQNLHPLRTQLNAKLQSLSKQNDWREDSLTRYRGTLEVVELIQQLEVIDVLLESPLDSLQDWEWNKRLRFYSRSNGVAVQMGNACFAYSWEFQGTVQKLVHTALTDRCFLVLTQALFFGLGGSPFGPAGTGKTESVKALGQALGRRVMVFNCDEQFDVESISRVFVGLMHCGFWGCFDEFNRLESSVLSSLAQQIQTIQVAMKDGKRKLCFFDKEVSLHEQTGVFVTMNPAGRLYRGRSKLPDNLKQLFRAVCMTYPDQSHIARVILAAEGFRNCTILGKKLVNFFKLCDECFSSKREYDWGLRALKSVLEMAGKLRREMEFGNEAHCIAIALHALKLPGLVSKDTSIFCELLNNAFQPLPENWTGPVHDIILQAAKELGLTIQEDQIAKTECLAMAMEQRMGVIVKGPPLSGKSTLWKLLQKSHHLRNEDLEVFTLSPKSIDRGALLGWMDPDTSEWTDGLLTSCIRRASEVEISRRVWIVCDGDIDPEWIESLNSVLDDNKLLTLPNGERIQLRSNVKFIFEVSDLEFVSPATISRCVVVHLSKNIIRETWSQSKESWASKLIPQIMTWVSAHEGCSIQSIVSFQRSMNAFLTSTTNKKECASLLFAFISQYLSQEATQDFCTYLEQLLDITDLTKVNEEITDQLFEKLKSIDLEPYIITSNFVKCLSPLTSWIDKGDPVLVLGEPASGKRALIDVGFKMFGISSSTVIEIYCNAATTPDTVLEKFQEVYGKSTLTNSGRILKKRDRKRVILLIRSVDVPKADRYKTIQLHEFLRQLISYGVVWDRSVGWLNVEDLQIIATARNLPSSPVSRFYSQFHIVSLKSGNQSDLESITERLLERVLPRELMPTIGRQKWQKKTVEVYSSLMDVCKGVDGLNQRMLVDWIKRLSLYSVTTIDDFKKVMFHEFQRAFCDQQSSNQTVQISKELFLKTFGSIGKKVASAFFALYLLVAEKDSFWMSVPTTDTNKPHEKLQELNSSEFQNCVQEKLNAFNRESTKLNLVLCPQALDCIHRLSHSLGSLRRCVMLTGAHGLGRRSLIQFLSHWHEIDLHTPPINQNFNLQNFASFLREVILEAGVKGKKLWLFLEEFQIINETTLHLINDLLSYGKVPGLFTEQEWRTLHESSSVKDSVAKRVQSNVQVIISFSCEESTLQRRLQSNPEFLRVCDLHYFTTWSETTISAIVQNRLKRYFEDKSDEWIQRIKKQLMKIYSSSGSSSSRQLVSFVELLSRIYHKKSTEIQSRIAFLKNGLLRLQEAEEEVDGFAEKTQEKQNLLEQKQKEAEDSLERITSLISQTADRKREVEDLTHKLHMEEEAMNLQKECVLQKLSDVQPMVDKAKLAVGQIKSDNLNEIRSLKMPPEAIRDVLEGVLTVLGHRDMTWNNMRQFLANKGVKEQIINFDAHSINKGTTIQLEKLMKNKGHSFEHSTIQRVSVAAAPLAAWVLDSIQPLEDELNRLSSSLISLKSNLETCTAELSSLASETGKLKMEFQKKTSETESIRNELEEAECMLKAAKTLFGKLMDERSRWKSQLQRLDQSVSLLWRHSILAAAYITFLASKTTSARSRALKEWSNDDFEFNAFMSGISTPLEIIEEELILENAFCVVHSIQWPLIIDPNNQVQNWITNVFGSGHEGVEVLNMSDPKLQRHLELALQIGKVLILTNADRIDPVLVEVFWSRTTSINTVFIGSKRIEIHECFKLVLIASGLGQISAQLRDFVNIIDASITETSLEDQLLDLTVDHVAPDLNKKGREISLQQKKQKLKLEELERHILDALAASTGNLLDNKDLIFSLDDAKTQSIELKKDILNLSQFKRSIESERDKYRPAAERVTGVFLSLSSLHRLNHVYRFGVDVLFHLYKQSLERSVSDKSSQINSDHQVATIVKAFLHILHSYTSLVVTKGDYLFYAFHLVKHSFPSLSPEKNEWEFLANTTLSCSLNRIDLISSPSWVPRGREYIFQELQSRLPDLVRCCKGFKETDKWREWVMSPNPEHSFPGSIRLNPLQKIILIASLCPERLPEAVDGFLLNILEPVPGYSIEALATHFHPEFPVLFIIATGSDPSPELRAYTQKKFGDSTFIEISLGATHNHKAIDEIKNCTLNGNWILVKNVHLTNSFIEQLAQEFQSWKKHSDFQLFLTTESTDSLPLTLLESSTKATCVTLESKPGIKQNMLQCHEAFIGGLNEIERFNSSLSFVLKEKLSLLVAWLHSVIQSRKELGGWKGDYEFSLSDFRTALFVMITCIKDPNDLKQWTRAQQLVKTVVYGGIIFHPQDYKVLEIYTKLILSPSCIGIGETRSPLPGTELFVDCFQRKERGFLDLVDCIPDREDPAIVGLPRNTKRATNLKKLSEILKKLKTLSEESNDPKQVSNRSQFHKTKLERFILEETNDDALETLEPANSVKDIVIHHLKSDLELARLLVEVLSTSPNQLPCLHQQKITSIAHDLLLNNEIDQDSVSTTLNYLESLQIDKDAYNVEKIVKSDGLKLGKILRPRLLLNALRWFASREKKTPIDELEVMCTWNKPVTDSTQYLSISGYKLQGALFDGFRLKPCKEEGELSSDLPTFALSWEVRNDSIETDGILVPLYENKTKEKILMNVILPCPDCDRDHWNLASLAIV